MSDKVDVRRIVDDLANAEMQEGVYGLIPVGDTDSGSTPCIQEVYRFEPTTSESHRQRSSCKGRRGK